MLRALIGSEHAGARLDLALARCFPQHSRSRLQAWVRAGRVVVDGIVVDQVTRKLWGGECVLVRTDPIIDQAPEQPEAIALAVVHEDDEIIVVDKPPGLVVHPGSGVRSGTLLNALLHHAPQLADLPRAGIVHRLDKDTSGLLVVAKTPQAQTALVRQLQSRSVKRLYRALVWGQVAADGVVDAPIGRHPRHRTKMAVVAAGRSARTHYRIMERLRDTTLLECSLDTGRTHQIRVHLASLAYPIVGDPKYGGARAPASPATRFPRQALHAWRLGLTHPASCREMSWESDLAADFAALLVSLRAGQEGR